MAEEARAELQKTPEHTRSGPVYTPAVDIFEDDKAITVLADLPGAKAENLEIDLRENVLTLTAPVTSPQGATEAVILREYVPGTYFRQFALAQTIDQAKIEAKLSDGVLRLELPKVEKAKPRQVTVKAG